MLLNCRLSFFSAHTLPESPLWLNRFIHCTNVQQLPLAVRNNCNCLSFAPLSLGFNLAPRSSLHNVFVLEDAASCSQQGVLFFFSLSIFSPSSSFCRGWSLRARLWTTDTPRRWDDLCRFFYEHLGWDLADGESLVRRERRASAAQHSTSTSSSEPTSALWLPASRPRMFFSEAASVSEGCCEGCCVPFPSNVLFGMRTEILVWIELTGRVTWTCLLSADAEVNKYILNEKSVKQEIK